MILYDSHLLRRESHASWQTTCSTFYDYVQTLKPNTVWIHSWSEFPRLETNWARRQSPKWSQSQKAPRHHRAVHKEVAPATLYPPLLVSTWKASSQQGLVTPRPPALTGVRALLVRSHVQRVTKLVSLSNQVKWSACTRWLGSAITVMAPFIQSTPRRWSSEGKMEVVRKLFLSKWNTASRI